MKQIAWVKVIQNKYIKRCMETLKKHLKDYEIIEWNEKNFDIDSNKFV